MVNISSFHKITVNKKKIFVIKAEEKQEKVKLAEMNKEIILKHSISLVDRNSIISSLIQILTQGDYDRIKLCPLNYYIIRTDIKNFFPSINKHKLYKKISNSNTLQPETLETIKKIVFNPSINGVPVGLPISTSLAELYLKDFDMEIKHSIQPYYYFRYVDDIIIINLFKSTNNQERNQEINIVKKKLKEVFKKNDLIINENKTNTVIHYPNNKFKNMEFKFLGYHFHSEVIQSQKKPVNKALVIDISPEKYTNKVYSKMYYYFNLYNKSDNNSADFWILYYQLKNLIHGTTSIKDNGKMNFGFSHSYKFINTTKHIIKLVKTFDYLVINSKLSKKQKHTIWSIVRKNSYGSAIPHDELLLLLKKRYNYTNLSKKQLYIICTRIGIPSYRYIAKNNLETQKLIMYYLYRS